MRVGDRLSTRDYNIFFFNDTATTEIYTLSLHDALPIFGHTQTMRALGFCVSVAHAHFMARYFNEHGLAAVALDASTPTDERRAALVALHRGDLRAVFAVDLLNEGVDVPAIDTVLFLRPTESATVFLQQLGRGLRRVDGKPCLTV